MALGEVLRYFSSGILFKVKTRRGAGEASSLVTARSTGDELPMVILRRSPALSDWSILCKCVAIALPSSALSKSSILAFARLDESSESFCHCLLDHTGVKSSRKEVPTPISAAEPENAGYCCCLAVRLLAGELPKADARIRLSVAAAFSSGNYRAVEAESAESDASDLAEAVLVLLKAR